MDNILKIGGGKQLAEALSQLPKNIERNIMRAALRAGASVIANEAKLNVPIKSGNLKRSIRTGSNTIKGGVEAYARAGGRSGGKNKNRSAFYAQFVEYGTAVHTIKPKNKKMLSFVAKDGAKVATFSVRHPGAKLHPFMRPALDAKQTEAIQAVAAKIRERLTQSALHKAMPKGND